MSKSIYDIGFDYARQRILRDNTFSHINPYCANDSREEWTEWNRGYNKGFCESVRGMSVDVYKQLTMSADEQMTFF